MINGGDQQMIETRGVPVDRQSLAWLLLTVFAAFALCLVFAPINSDQLALLSNAAEARHPFGYFVGDWGLGNNQYRPLLPFMHWFEFRAFGVGAWPYQLLGLVLLLAVAALIFELITSVGAHLSPALRFLLTLVAVVSPYTTSAATWVADRTSMMAAFFLLLLIRHLYLAVAPPRAWSIAVLSVAAIMSRETGVVAPALVVLYGWTQKRPRLVVLGLAMIAGYGLLRFVLFGAAATVYPESGVLIGFWGYEDSSELNTWQYAWMLIENPLKHAVATGLPLFDEEGGIRSRGDLWLYLPLWLSTAVMAVASARRLSGAQKLALAVIAFNAGAHFALFRYRTVFLGHLAFVVFVAASPALAVPSRRRLVTVMAAIVLVANVVWVEYQLLHIMAPQFDDVGLLGDIDGELVDPAIWDAIRQRYFP